MEVNFQQDGTVALRLKMFNYSAPVRIFKALHNFLNYFYRGDLITCPPESSIESWKCWFCEWNHVFTIYYRQNNNVFTTVPSMHVMSKCDSEKQNLHAALTLMLLSPSEPFSGLGLCHVCFYQKHGSLQSVVFKAWLSSSSSACQTHWPMTCREIRINLPFQTAHWIFKGLKGADTSWLG